MLFERKRCMIPADGFYEWKQMYGRKQPMSITMWDGEPFAFASLFDTWTSPNGQKLHSCTIITTRPNEVVADIHDRLPVILGQEDENLWLDLERFDLELLRSVLVSYNAGQMKAYPVPAMVGNPKNEASKSIENISEPA